MKVCFIYHMANGAMVGLPLEVDEHRPFGAVVEDAHEIALEAFGPCSFRTVVIRRHACTGPRPIGEIVRPIVERATPNNEHLTGRWYQP